jgi:hypothetical protein
MAEEEKQKETKKITIAGWAPHKLAKDGGGEFIRSEYHCTRLATDSRCSREMLLQIAI